LPTLLRIILHTALLNWNRKCSGMGVPIGDRSEGTIYKLSFADDQMFIAQEYEDGVYGLFIKSKTVGYIPCISFC
jgi:hypothetical protein